jgi:REP element-mobilizing transposase RayT
MGVEEGARASRPQDAAKMAAIPEPRPHKGWHERGYLPHFDHPDLLQFISFRLHDSVPAEVIQGWRAELRLSKDCDPSDPRVVELRDRIAKFEDEGHGSCSLKDPRIAALVQDALHHFDGDRYRLLAWCVMPNHVHLLIETREGWPLGDILHSWKSFTAKRANRILDRTGQFWMEEYFDRFIRNEKHYVSRVEYIEQNPVHAGLCARAEQWRFSSAGARASRPQDAAKMAAIPTQASHHNGASAEGTRASRPQDAAKMAAFPMSLPPQKGTDELSQETD